LWCGNVDIVFNKGGIVDEENFGGFKGGRGGCGAGEEKTRPTHKHNE